MMLILKRSLLGALALTVALVVETASCKVNLREDYVFPYSDPYLSSLSIRLLQPAGTKAKMLMMDGLPGRDQVPLIEGRERIEIMVLAQKKPAPLVFLVPGTGGTATEGGELWLAEQLYQQGFSAITLPSPFFWKFVLSQSTTAIPGFSPEDARDLRRLMVESKKKAERELGLQVTRVAAAGYSLGGVNVAFVMKLEREQKVLGLERAVMINPALSIPYALEEMDRLNAIGDNWSRDDRDALWGYTMNVGMKVLGRDPNDPAYFLGLDKILNISSNQLKFLIGNSFRQTLGDTIFTSQQITPVGILKVKASSGLLSGRQAEAQRVSFTDYMSQAAYPYWTKRLGKSWTLAQFVAAGDLMAHKEFLAKDKGLRMMHNVDDFIVRSKDLNEIANLMGERAVIYPAGGHVGNLWPETNRSDLALMLSDLF